MNEAKASTALRRLSVAMKRHSKRARALGLPTTAHRIDCYRRGMVDTGIGAPVSPGLARGYAESLRNHAARPLVGHTRRGGRSVEATDHEQHETQRLARFCYGLAAVAMQTFADALAPRDAPAVSGVRRARVAVEEAAAA